MIHALTLQAAGGIVAEQRERLLACNDTTRAYGLVLTEDDVKMLIQTRAESLRETGRIEFGEGIAAQLIYAFADSPYLTQSNYADTIAALLVLFDTFKNEMKDAYNDRELLTFMRNAFDGECAGSLEILETEVFPRLLTGGGQDDSGYKTAADARFAENDTPQTTVLERTRTAIRRQHHTEDGEADGKVYDTVPEIWEDENGRQV